MQNNYFIQSFEITNLWGYQDIDLIFSKDVNVLIGPNGSGKTTVLNLLHSILFADLRGVLDIKFEHAEIKLKSFDGKSTRTVKVDVSGRRLNISVRQKKFEFNINAILGRRISRYVSSDRGGTVLPPTQRVITRGRTVPRELYDELTTLVPIVWLPVSRRLPVTEDEEDRYTRANPLESVDLRLEELLRDLFHYYSDLNALLSRRYKEFEHQVLSMILYSKDLDRLDLTPSLPTKAEKTQLLGAFEAAGLLNKQMRGRIDEHFTAAEEVVQRINSEDPDDLKPGDSLVVPLIRRTQAMVEYAGKLEEDREKIFAPLRLYEKTVNSFLNDKSIQVDESGRLKITLSHSADLDLRLLSSGEKQILILLTEALLMVDKPVVYIADESELSLHISWQEKFLESLTRFGGQMQVIVATHSPDIVGKFQDKIIDLGRKI